MRWLDGITGPMDTSVSKLWETVENRAAWHVAVHAVAELGTTEKALTHKLYSYSCTPEETLPSVHQRAHPRTFIENVVL